MSSPEAAPSPIAGPERPVVESIDDIAGWFTPMDQALFRHTLSWQRSASVTGTLVELGCFMGKSTVVIGEYVGDDRFVVVDLFGRTDLLEGATEGNKTEVAGSSYQRTHGQDAFEHNYASLHDGRLPDVVAGLSSSVADHVGHQEVRFCHIDASHDYEAVRTDIEICSRLVAPGGVVVLDDYRTEHTPGVAAAAWGAVREGLIIPVLLSTQKMYAVYADPEPYREAMAAALTDDDRWTVGTDVIEGHLVRRVHYRRDPQAAVRARGETATERRERLAREEAAAAARAAEAAEREAEAAARAAEREAAARRAAEAEAEARRRIAAAAEAERLRALAASRTLPRRVRRVVLALVPPVVAGGARRLKHAVRRSRRT